MKIALVCPYDLSYRGGVAGHVLALAREYKTRGHDVTVIGPASSRRELPEYVISLHGSIQPVPFAGAIARVDVSPSVVGEVEHLLGQQSYDVLHLHEPLVPLVSIAALLTSRAVTVATFHAGNPSNWLYEVSRPLLQPLLDLLDARIAVSAVARDTVARYFPGDYTVIPLGIDVEHFRPGVAPIERFADGKFNILFVGRLDERKGLPHLLRAFPQVKQAIPEARLIVAGAYSPEEAARYAGTVRGLKDVEFVGPISEADKPRYYRTAAVFCAPATGFESFGQVLLEAMACGTPIVASDIEGYRSSMTHGREGLMAPPGDERAIAEALIELQRAGWLRRRMGAEGRRTAEKYAMPRIADELLACYSAHGSSTPRLLRTLAAGMNIVSNAVQGVAKW